MREKISITLLLTIVMTMCFGMTAFASPKTMPDGTVFDAEYYAKTYPDVVSAIGTDENALYQHYVMAGKAEGRHPVTPVQTTESKPSANSSNLDKILAEIQNRFSTGTVATSAIGGASRLMTYNSDDSIDSYIEPIIQLCAQNGYKYVLCCDSYADTDPFNGSCHTRNNDYMTEYIIFVSNNNVAVDHGYYNLDGKEVIKICIHRDNKSYDFHYGTSDGKVTSPTMTRNKNDMYVTMKYDGFYSESDGNTGYTVVREIPVN